MKRLSALLICLLLATLAVANNGVVRLSSFPTISVADGRSSVTISAEIRDRQGNLVPNGTQVIFSANLGSFSESVVRTTGGIARAVFSTGSVAGVAKIQASALQYNAVNTLDLELVADRTLLSTAKEYIEVTADKQLHYSMDLRTIGASDSDGVTIRFRDIEITASDVQVSVPTYEVRARKARLKFGKVDSQFEELYFTLNTRRGFGTTTIEVPDYSIEGMGSAFRFKKSMKKRFGMAQVNVAGLSVPKTAVSPQLFVFQDILDSTSMVAAKKAVAFPKGTVQFHKAELYVGTNKLMSLPLFQVNMYGATPMVTEQIVNVYNNQLQVNYPYYMSLKPGETSLFRVRTGEQQGRGFQSSTGGIFLDYELSWNRGDNMEGGVTVSGLTRKDWGISARQFLRIDDRTFANAQIDLPAHRSIFGSASVNRQFDGFQFNLNANASRQLKGLAYQTTTASAILEKDPTKLGKLPFQLFYGLTANSQTSQYTDPTTNVVDRRKQESVGFRTRLQMIPQQLDRSTSLSASASLSKLFGTGVNAGLASLVDLSLTRRFGNNASVAISYNYNDDGFANSFTGKHGLTAFGIYEDGKISFTGSISRSLDFNRQSMFFDASYQMSPLWRWSYSMTMDQFLGSKYLEDYAMLSYRLGMREIGVSYSIRERRFGFELFGAQIR